MLEHTQWSALGPDIWVRWSTAQPSLAEAPGVSLLDDSLSLLGPQSGPEHLFAGKIHITGQHRTILTLVFEKKKKKPKVKGPFFILNHKFSIPL